MARGYNKQNGKPVELLPRWDGGGSLPQRERSSKRRHSSSGGKSKRRGRSSSSSSNSSADRQRKVEKAQKRLARHDDTYKNYLKAEQDAKEHQKVRAQSEALAAAMRSCFDDSLKAALSTTGLAAPPAALGANAALALPAPTFPQALAGQLGAATPGLLGATGLTPTTAPGQHYNLQPQQQQAQQTQPQPQPPTGEPNLSQSQIRIIEAELAHKLSFPDAGKSGFTTTLATGMRDRKVAGMVNAFLKRHGQSTPKGYKERAELTFQALTSL